MSEPGQDDWDSDVDATNQERRIQHLQANMKVLMLRVERLEKWMKVNLTITEKGRRILELMKDRELFDEACRNVDREGELPAFIAELERLKAERDKVSPKDS